METEAGDQGPCKTETVQHEASLVSRDSSLAATVFPVQNPGRISDSTSDPTLPWTSTGVARSGRGLGAPEPTSRGRWRSPETWAGSALQLHNN